MKVTKANIIKTINAKTGITPRLSKYEGEYYWEGKEASLFDECCTHYTTLSHPNITIASFVKDFELRIKKVELEFELPIQQIVNSIDWNVELEWIY